MNLDAAQTFYFVEQVGMAAASFGVATADITIVATALSTIFDYKCANPVTLAPALGLQLQSICQADNCPLAVNNTCSLYPPSILPAVANATLAEGQGNASATAPPASTGVVGASPTGSSSSTSAPSATPTSAAARFVGGVAAAVVALVAFML